MLTCGKKIGQSLTDLVAELGTTETNSVKAERKCAVAQH
jgi:hypothetical protein